MPTSQKAPNIIGRLPSGRPIIRNRDGSVSTHENTIINFDDRYFLIPTIFGGRRVTIDEAITRIRQNKFKDPDTGLLLPNFATPQQARNFELSQRPFLEEIGAMLSKQRLPMGQQRRFPKRK